MLPIPKECLSLFARYLLISGLCLIGLYLLLLRHTADLEMDRLEAIEAERLQGVARELAESLEPSFVDTLVLAESRAIQDYLATPDEPHRQRLEEQFLTQLRHQPRYLQIRYLDHQGRERVRVEHRNGRLLPTPPAQLQDKAHRPYVQETLALPAGRVNISALDLNVENGVLERPLRPTLRFSTPVADERGQVQGLVVINLWAGALLGTFDAAMNDVWGEAALLDAGGDWLRAPDLQDAWGRQLGHGRSFARYHPRDWAVMTAQGTGQLVTETGDRLTFLRFSPTTLRPVRGAGQTVQSAHDWFLVSRVDAGETGRQMWLLLSRQESVLVLLLVVLVIGSALLARGQNRHRRQARRLQRLIDTLPQGLLLHRRGRVVYGNGTALELFGAPDQEALAGKSALELAAPAWRERIRQRHREISLQEALPAMESEILRLDGQTVPVETRAVVIDLDGEPTNLTVLTDIGERKRLEGLRQAFVSTVSHELRTPLTSIKGALELVTSGATGELPPRARTMLEIATKNSRRLVLLINDLLDIDKLESGHMPFDLQPQPLDDLLCQALEAMEDYARDKGIGLRLDLQGHPWARVDAHRLHQALLNLLSNAVKFSPPQGVVEISLTVQEDQARISVRDHGDGIPEAFRPRIFERFAQADSGSDRTHPGTGLGLAITRAIVERTGGRISFETATGQGTTFHLDLPCLGNVQRLPDTLPPTMSLRPQSGRILHIEDDADLRAVVAEQLSHAVQVEGAAGVEQARALLRQQSFDLVLLDLELPDGWGWELLADIGQLSPAPPVVLFTQHPVSTQSARQVAAVRLKSRTEVGELVGTVLQLIDQNGSVKAGAA